MAEGKVSNEDKVYKKLYGFSNPTDSYAHISKKGLSEGLVREISAIKKEPEWMLEKRLEGFKMYNDKPLPRWGVDFDNIDFDDIYYYLKPTEKKSKSWEDVPEDIKNTFEKLGIPEAERKFFAGVEAQFDSEAVYGSVRDALAAQGVIFTDMDTAVREHPEIVKKYFGTVIPPNDNKFAALNTAVWSGGAFIYVPKGVKVSIPVQAYFRLNAEKAGQFERTLIIAEEGSEVTSLEGCTAPIFSSSSLHAGVVEVIAHKNATVRYITVQNWSKNVYNLVTQRAVAHENAHVSWIDTNVGSGRNMKYPCVILKGVGASGEIISFSLAGKNQVQDTGGKVFHLAPNTVSRIISKSVSKGNGLTTYRGMLYIDKKANNAKSTVKCDALLLDDTSRTNTYPYNVVQTNDAVLAHEATTGKLEEEKLFYLMSRGLSEDDAVATVVMGFIEPLVKVLPLEYTVELKRLIKLDTSNAIA